MAKGDTPGKVQQAQRALWGHVRLDHITCPHETHQNQGFVKRKQGKAAGGIVGPWRTTMCFERSR